jgi:hypothetical protein
MARTKKPTGRPSTYSPEVAQRILDRVSEGEMLTKICLLMKVR